MSRLKDIGTKAATCLDELVEKARKLSGCTSLHELFLRATMANSPKKHLGEKKAIAAYNHFWKTGRLVHWVRRVFHKIVQGRLKLPELKPGTA